MTQIFYHKAIDMTLLDWFATHAPTPSENTMSMERVKDRNKARTNDSYVMRDDRRIECELRYLWAKEMMKARSTCPDHIL